MKTRLILVLMLLVVLLIPGVITLADDTPGVPRLAITWDQTNSVPSFSGGAWSAFPGDQAQVAKGGLVVAYSGPLSAASVPTVTLRPGTAAAVINCTVLPAPASRLPDECYYQIVANQVRIYYMGNLAVGEDVAYTVSGLTALINPAANPVDNVDSSTTGVAMTPGALSRDPAAMVLVLDKSGSMNWSPDPFAPGCSNFVTVADADPCGPPRWTILKRAASAVLDVAEPYAVTGDEFAVSIFDSAVSFSSGFDPINSVTIGALEGQLNILAPGGATSIGAGLEQFTTFDGNNRNQVMVFSDGDQNTAPFVASNGVDVVINPTANSPIGPGVQPYVPSPAGVSLCPFALRADDPASPTDTEYMQDIADLRCDGNNIFAFGIAPSSPELVQYFLQFLDATLFGDKLELATVRSGASTPTEETLTETFTVENDVLAFTVLLTWAEPFNRVGNFSLEKDGVTFDNTAPTLIAEPGEGHLAVTLREPFCDVEANCADVGGEWAFTFEPSFGQSETFTYNLFLNVDNRSLASEYSVTQAAPGVGEPLILEVVLTEAGEPIEGLADGSVKAIVARPDAGLGNVLSVAEIAPLQIDQTEPVSAAALKVWAMMGDPTLQATLLSALDASTIQELTLIEEEPGIYRATFADVAVEGVYKVRFIVEADAPQNGAFTRVYSIDRYVRVVPDPTSFAEGILVTEITENCAFANGCFAIVVKPVDKLGNLLGPGKASLFTLPDFKGALLADTQDHLDGSYTIRIGYPEGVTDKPTLDIFGTTVTVEDVNPEPREDEDGGIGDTIQDNPVLLCLILLVILLVIVLLFWLMRRRRPATA